MNETDDLWQRAIDEECARWSARPAHELTNLPPCAKHEIGAEAIKYVLWHENPENSRDLEFHSFILQANRKSTLYTKNYLAGFALDENGAVVPIDDDILARYD